MQSFDDRLAYQVDRHYSNNNGDCPHNRTKPTAFGWVCLDCKEDLGGEE